MSGDNSNPGGEPAAGPSPKPPPDGASFFGRNRDKILLTLLSLVIGGVGGFFSAVFVLKDEINAVDDRLIVLERDASSSWRPGAESITDLERRAVEFERSLNEFKQKNEADALLRDRLRQINEETRKQTVSELRGLLKESP